MLDIEDFAGVRLGAGSLYGCLAKLEAQGLVEPLPSDDRRRPYRITPTGKAALKEQLEKSRRLAAVGLRRIAQA
jgi:DNA-binding PadR family transcriptional regulator